MKFLSLTIASLAAGTTVAFCPPMSESLRAGVSSSSSSSLNMVLEKPAAKKISKLETLKVNSANLLHPLKEVRLFFRFYL